MIRSRMFLQFAIVGVLISVVVMGLSFTAAHWMRRISDSQRFNMEPARTFVLNEYGDIIQPKEYSSEDADLIERAFADRHLPREHRPGPPRPHVVKLDQDPVQYVVFVPPRPPRPGFAMIFGIQLATVIGAVMLTLFVVAVSVRGRARLAENVIQQLTVGNLKARFPVTKVDEIGQMMLSFNKMADQIEHLVERLQKTEAARKELLQQLAHDLRTPIASIKNILETVKDKSDALNEEGRNSLLNIGVKEIEYFNALVDDLLFLGEVEEPRFKKDVQEVSLQSLFESEIEALSQRNKNIDIKSNILVDQKVVGDPRLLRRLFRNALENAVSFARSSVTVSAAETESNKFQIVIRDDGPGFEPNALAGFGRRKFSRVQASGGRISIGLGSVIMKSIVETHQGSLEARNHPSGAEVLITLKTN